jgi:hypothetical protein
MSVLKRKLFNKGGQVSSRGVGITSGLVIPKYEHGGLHTQEDFFEQNREMLGKYYQPQEEQSRLRAASPALLALGSALLSGRSFQGGVGGALEILGGATAQATPFFDDMIKQRRAEKNAARQEAFNLDMKALDFAREDMEAQEAKFKPLEFGDELLRLTPEGTYETISTKPSKLVEAYDNVLNDNVFVSEALIRADAEAAAAPVAPGEDSYAQRYAVKRTIDKDSLVEVYDTEKKTYTYIPEDTLMALSKKAVDDPDFEPRYVPKAPDNDFVTMYDTDLKQNVTVFKSAVIESIDKGENKYEAKRDGINTIKQVYSKSLDANIYVTQGNILADMNNDLENREYSEPKDDPTFKTYYDPLLDKNVLATDQDVADRLEKDTDNAFLPKRADKKDTILTMFHKKTKKNVLVTEAEVLDNMDQYEAEKKTDTQKSAIDTKTNELVFVTNEQIAESDGRYKPAIIGQHTTVDADGNVVMKDTLVGTSGMADDTSDKLKELRGQLDSLTIFATDVLNNMEDSDIDSAFGLSGWFIDFSNKYLTQAGLPYNEQVAEARADIVELSNRVMRLVTDDSRFTNEDRAYINRITGLSAMDKIQSYDQVLTGVRQIQTMLEDRLTEISGQQGMKASHEMSVAELIDAYNNYRKINNIKWKGFDKFTIKTNLPKLNKEQFSKRMEVYHPDEYADIQAGKYNK